MATQREFFERVGKKVDMTAREAGQAISATVDSIVELLKREGKVKLPGLGIFTFRTSKARMGRNPQTGEPIKIPARKRVAFRASKQLKDTLGVQPKAKGGRR